MKLLYLLLSISFSFFTIHPPNLLLQVNLASIENEAAAAETTAPPELLPQQERGLNSAEIRALWGSPLTAQDHVRETPCAQLLRQPPSWLRGIKPRLLSA